MEIGIPKEIMNSEFRVGVVPAGVNALVKAGHRVLVQQGAGSGSGISDAEFAAVGAVLVQSAPEVFARAGMIIKVKEPLPSEYEYLRPGQILFTYLHLAPKPELTEFLCRRKISAIGYETVQFADGSLPLLAPMSQVAGRMAVQVGARYLERTNGGAGILLGGVPGVDPGRVTILGPGVVGINATRVALAMGAHVTVIGPNMERLARLDELYGGRITTLVSNEYNISRQVADSDLVVGAALIPGGAAPKLVSGDMVARMRPGSVIIDVAIDQGGCVETSRATSHAEPTFTVGGVIHYGVANMPGAVPRTSTFALTNATLPYALEIADKGLVRALRGNASLRKGLNVYDGMIVQPNVARSQGKEWRDPFRDGDAGGEQTGGGAAER
ncbi:MAG: alanine dehydrogenase [Desulfobulbaceae bacterium]|nr:alanine dehydrogenase [Desulfobulbaceae bacterium]MDY0349697.1 alanine dehydrogenase [Desulfobulbaceae bacterium]